MSFVFVDRESTYPNKYLVTPESGNSYYVILERADEPVVVGTPLNAETFNNLIAALGTVKSVNGGSPDENGNVVVTLSFPKTTALDFSGWESGSFTETLSDGSTVDYNVEFNESGAVTNVGGIAVSGLAASEVSGE